jgi:hypothetical protein
MTPHPRWKAYVLSASVASEFNWIFAASRFRGLARPALGGSPDDARRGLAHRGEHCAKMPELFKAKG